MSYLNLLFSRLGVAAIMTRQNTAVITANTRQTETRKLANHKETLSDRCWFCLYFGLLTFGKRLRMSGVDLSIKHTSFCLSLHHDFYLPVSLLFVLINKGITTACTKSWCLWQELGLAFTLCHHDQNTCFESTSYEATLLPRLAGIPFVCLLNDSTRVVWISSGALYTLISCCMFLPEKQTKGLEWGWDWTWLQTDRKTVKQQ